MQEGKLLWTPRPEQVESANITAFCRWLEHTQGQHLPDYASLWRWSTTDVDGFWQALWDYFDIEASTPPSAVRGRRTMPGTQWFPGARLNYAQHVLRGAQRGGDALLSMSETQPLRALPWETLAQQVRGLATELRAMGVQPGDRVAAWMPNRPETLVALLATTAIGAVWACCSPDFGARGVLDRLTQLSPKVLFCIDGYRYGGKQHDRRDELAHIVGALDSLTHVVLLPGPDSDGAHLPDANVVRWDALMDRPPVQAADFRFEQVPFDHPLWVLFSSGTTGLPKAIVHGHGGILLETLKNASFHFDLHPGERIFFHTTSGWMLWNFLVGTTLTGALPVLYDGNPAYPERDMLWRMVQDARATHLGASPTYVDQLARAGVVPGERYDLSALRMISLAGSPATAECMAWFYDNVKADLWVANGSGGTDCCTGFVGGVPTQPVHAGEIQGPSLGVAVKAFDGQGHALIDEVGELVITEPMPSMPLYFWNDADDMRYRETYFDTYPGIWRHGDYFRIRADGACFVLGRSDATLNRHGVRIGTAEIYRSLARIDEIEAALIVNLDLPGGRFYMPLFVKLAEGLTLDEALEAKICARLKSEFTPRHVPDEIHQVPEIPATITGKTMEVPVRRILMGAPPEAAANRSAMANPGALDYFIAFAAQRRGGETVKT
ncbi:acetoacetate--CoA ligase [Denitromonas iodatirespirans]|nr:acetoacetate--CoA ligase [Denitromonas iodatirespirans]